MTGTPDPRPHRQRHRRHRAPVGASPGTLAAPPCSPPSQIALCGYAPDRLLGPRPGTVAELAELRRTWPTLWVDVTGFGDVAQLQAIGEQFGLHRLALEDVLNLQQRAKVEDYGAHTFLVLRMVDPTDPDATEQFGMFVGQGFVLTFQERPGDCFGMVRQRLQDTTGQMRCRGADYLAYALLDAVVDAYFPVVEELDSKLAQIEERILGGRPDRTVMGDLHAVRRRLLVLRRAIWPLREAASSLVRGDARHFTPAVQPYLRDVHDHVVQLLDLLENYREISNSLMELHLSTVNHRLNEVIKLLTIISTIFIPLTFVVGVYGMNFDHMPELRSVYGYPACLLGMLLLAALMLRWFRRRGWL